MIHTMILMLSNRWHALCVQAGLDGVAGWTRLVQAYEESTRAYHNLTHIADCLYRFDEYLHLAENPVAVELAIWFHDMVYDTRAPDNEERSALAAMDFLSGTSLGNTVADLIRATNHDGSPGSNDAALLCDIDLSILGREPAEYEAYACAIRKEYAWVPPVDYAKGRIRVLESFLGRPSIFALAEMKNLHEERARANLKREIAGLAKT